MKLFQNLFGKGGIEIAAPVSGKLVAISEVNDPTFGDEILGKGVAVIPSDNRICAPADCVRVSTSLPPTRGNGAMGLIARHHRSPTGDFGCGDPDQISGLDTVANGQKHVTIHAKGRRQGKKGDLLWSGYRARSSGRVYDRDHTLRDLKIRESSRIRDGGVGDVTRAASF